MTTFSIITGAEVPEPPPERQHNPGRFIPLFECARSANGEWIAIQANGELQPNRLPNLASRIRSGKILGASEGEFEVRTKSREGKLWIRSTKRPLLRPR